MSRDRTPLIGGELQPNGVWGVSTRMLIILAMVAGLAILMAFTIQVLLASN